MIFYDKKHEEYYTFNIPHPRRIILNKNNLNLGDDIGIISIKNYKKLAKKEKLKTENYPDYTKKKNETELSVLVKERSSSCNSFYPHSQRKIRVVLARFCVHA